MAAPAPGLSRGPARRRGALQRATLGWMGREVDVGAGTLTLTAACEQGRGCGCLCGPRRTPGSRESPSWLPALLVTLIRTLPAWRVTSRLPPFAEVRP